MAKKHPVRTENLRRALAQEAARVMAEHGISDFLFATEPEAALQEYLRIFLRGLGADPYVRSETA